MKNILYLHIGWSKTGTSAIQKRLQNNYEVLLKHNILYPQSLQWGDHAHHEFALSFKKNTSGVYHSKYNPAQTLEILRKEFLSTKAENVLISSELSPVYFQNDVFTTFVRENFNKVVVIATVRRQSELLLSMYNQLIKDPNVRYAYSLFCLFARQANYLNFNQQLQIWLKFVTKNDVIVLPYGKDIVDRFLEVIGIAPSDISASLQKSESLNVSLPHRILLILQAHQQQLNNSDYLQLTQKLVQLSLNIEPQTDSVILFSEKEQQGIDQHFAADNMMVSRKFGDGKPLFAAKSYQSLYALPADYRYE